MSMSIIRALPISSCNASSGALSRSLALPDAPYTFWRVLALSGVLWRQKRSIETLLRLYLDSS